MTKIDLTRGLRKTHSKTKIDDKFSILRGKEGDDDFRLEKQAKI